MARLIYCVKYMCISASAKPGKSLNDLQYEHYLFLSMNAEVLKTRTEMPDILSVVSNHLFGQLEGYIVTDNQAVVKKWEVSNTNIQLPWWS